MGTPCYYLNVHIRGYDAEIFVNGAPIMRSDRSYAILASPPVSEWMVQGTNLLTVTVEGGDHIDPPPEEAPGEEGDPAAADGGATAAAGESPPPEGGDGAAGEADEEPPLLRVALCQGEVGDYVIPGEEDELVVLEWEPPPPPEEGEEGLVLPHEAAADPVDLTHPWGTWSWEGADVVDLAAEPEAVLDIARLLADLHAGVAAGDLTPLLTASQTKFDEVAPCYEFAPQDARDRMPAAWPDITAPAGWALAPFDEADLELRPVCGGRVLEARTLAGEPVLRQAERLEDTRWFLPLFLARVDGDYRVVR